MFFGGILFKYDPLFEKYTDVICLVFGRVVKLQIPNTDILKIFLFFHSHKFCHSSPFRSGVRCQ